MQTENDTEYTRSFGDYVPVTPSTPAPPTANLPADAVAIRSFTANGQDDGGCELPRVPGDKPTYAAEVEGMYFRATLHDDGWDLCVCEQGRRIFRPRCRSGNAAGATLAAEDGIGHITITPASKR